MKTLFKFFVSFAVLLVPSAIAYHVTGSLESSISLAMVAPVGFVDITRARVAYERIIEMVKMINTMFGVEIIATEGALRTEQLITAQDTLYQFQTVQQNMNNIQGFPLQRGVDQNDVFIGLNGGLYIDHRTDGQSDVLLQTYPNPFQFTAGNTNNPASLQAFYNATWRYEVGSRIFIPGDTTAKFSIVPRTQQSSAVNFSGWSLKETLKELDPYLVFSGKGTNKLNIAVTGYVGYNPSAISGQNVLTFFFTGLTLQNAAGYVRFFTGESSLEDAFKKWARGAGYDPATGSMSNPSFKLEALGA